MHNIQPSLTHSSLSLTHSLHSHSLTHPLTHSPHPLTHSPLTHSPTHHTHTHSLTPSLPHSLPPSLTRSLTHFHFTSPSLQFTSLHFTHSLTHSHTSSSSSSSPIIIIIIIMCQRCLPATGHAERDHKMCGCARKSAEHYFGQRKYGEHTIVLIVCRKKKTSEPGGARWKRSNLLTNNLPYVHTYIDT